MDKKMENVINNLNLLKELNIPSRNEKYYNWNYSLEQSRQCKKKKIVNSKTNQQKNIQTEEEGKKGSNKKEKKIHIQTFKL